MSIVVAVKNKKGVAIAADTLSSNEIVVTPAGYKTDPSKLVRCGNNIMGFVGDCITLEVFRNLIQGHPEKFDLSGKQQIFASLLGIHKLLKSQYYLDPQEVEDNSFELSPIHALIVNPNGIFQVTEDRHVTEYTRFWAVGSGAQLALGAMHSLYGRCDDAATIATAGVEAACEFEANCRLPVECHLVAESAPIQKPQNKMNGVHPVETNLPLDRNTGSGRRIIILVSRSHAA